MKVSDGYLTTWTIASAVLGELEPVEASLVPDIAHGHATTTSSIQGLPGAFDFDSTVIQSIALTIYPVIAAGVAFAAPKLFDALIDIGKDSVKKLVEKRIRESAAVARRQDPVDEEALRKVVFEAASIRRLAPSTANLIANAIIVELSRTKAVRDQ